MSEVAAEVEPVQVVCDALWQAWKDDGPESLIRADCENGARIAVTGLSDAGYDIVKRPHGPETDR